MGTAFNPGLIVKRNTVVSKMRRLPIKGDVLVKEGDIVAPDTVVARALLPGELQTIKINEKLNVEPNEVKETLKVKKGDTVKKGDLIAETKMFFGLFKSDFKSPFDGEIEYFTEVTGHLGLRRPPVPVEVNAYIRGKVEKVVPKEAAVIITRGTLIQGIFGVGGEQQGVLEILVKSADEELNENNLPENCKGKIFVGGSLVSSGFIKKACERGAKGIIVGGIIDKDLTEFLGYEIGVAVTGHEDIPASIIITEGFGKISMAKRTFEILKSLNGKTASINGATQIRAGAQRPEIIISDEVQNNVKEEKKSAEESLQLKIGTPIRVIRVPYFGILGKVKNLPPELVRIDTESEVRVLQAELSDGRIVTVPRANVEIIEQE